MHHTPGPSPAASTGWPEPDAPAQAHSERLIARIRAEIAAQGGQITLARYLELALYEPGLGYYSAGSRKFGAAGDFVTAPEISPWFARTLAVQIAEVLAQLRGGSVLEIGAGSGRMAADLLAALEQARQLPAQYLILELSADLRQRQQALLRERVPQLMPRVQWLDALPESGFTGVMLANEVLDALPVHGFRQTAAGIEERYIRWDGKRFAWHAAAPSTPALIEAVRALGAVLPDGYESEVCLALPPWLAALAACLRQGVALLLDYGFPRHEYYHPQRERGTLLCYYRHRAHDDPFVYPGLQDITAHVDFTAVAQAATDAGLDVLGYNTQGAFLLANGIAELAGFAADPRRQLQNAQQIRTLTMPEEMGELFKVMALGRDYHHALRGFALQDLRNRL